MPEAFLVFAVIILNASRYTGMDLTAGPPVPTGEFPGGPASFVMRRSDGPVDFLDTHRVEIGKPVDFLEDILVTNLAGPIASCG